MNITTRWISRIVILFAVSQLIACTTISTPDAVDDPNLEWSIRQSKLNQISHWKINGRVAITSKAEVWHLSVIWKQDDQQYKIHLSGPFGAGAVQLKGDLSGVTIKSDDKTTFAVDPEQLLYETAGVQIPLKNLFYWIKGLPNPESQTSNQEIDSYGRLKTLTQNEWTIRFKRYNNEVDLPSKIFIKRNSLDIRFIIDDWSISS